MRQKNKKNQSNTGKKEGRQEETPPGPAQARKLHAVENPEPQRGPALEREENMPSADQDSSSTVDVDTSSGIDEEEGEQTTLSQSEVQEGPKGGKPQHEKKRPA